MFDDLEAKGNIRDMVRWRLGVYTSETPTFSGTLRRIFLP